MGVCGRVWACVGVCGRVCACMSVWACVVGRCVRRGVGVRLCCSFETLATSRGEGASLEVEIGSGRRQARPKGGAAISLHVIYISASARVGGLAGGGRRGRGGFGHRRWRWRWRRRG